MALQVQLRSKEQILADLIRSILINTDLNDVAPGSSLGTILEGIATSHFQIAASALKILESSNLESLVGTDLDKKAISIKLPNGVGGVGRKPATQAINIVVIGSAFEKISSKQYSGKPAPFAGSTKLFLEDASKFPIPGPNTRIYIGRGTVDRFEGPIQYTALVNSGSFWEMTLANPLTKNHLASDLVTLAQGGDRVVPAGTIVQTPVNNNSVAVQFKTTEEIVILDGEAEGTVQVACTQAGEVGNVLSGAITEFSTPPFSGATVINRTSFNNGSSSEGDEDLRIRIKNYPSTLSRGTATAILSALQGAIDPVSGRSIQSAVILEPVEPGDSARVFIDDNTGLEPTFDGQAYELLRKSASGQEKKFRTAQFPITPAVAIGSNFGPFTINDTMTLIVHLDETIETYTITSSNYKNLNSINTYELARDFNNQSNIVGFRTLDEGKRIAIFDLSGTAEILKVEAGTLQEILGLPTVDIRSIYLYKDSKIQSFRGRTATVETRPRNQWASFSSGDVTNVRVNVDGVIQKFTITDADFTNVGATMNTASVSQWASVFRKKIAGVKFTVAGQRIIWSSWQQYSADSYIEIMETREDGSPAPWIGSTKVWLPKASGGKLSDRGFEKDFKFNRFTGEINFINKPEEGKTIEIASENTRAFIRSLEAQTGLFDVSANTEFGNSRFVVGFDGDFEVREVSVPDSATINFSSAAIASDRTYKITANNIDVFKNAKVGDYVYLVKSTVNTPSWGSEIENLYLIKAKGFSTTATNIDYPGLTATTGVNVASLTLFVTRGSGMVRVNHPNHKLESGDKVYVLPSAGAGGLTIADLTATNEKIVVIDENNYEYPITATTSLPTSNASAAISKFASSVYTISHTNHGFNDGARVNLQALSPTTFGGKVLADLNTPIPYLPSLETTGVYIRFVDKDTYRISCDFAATDLTQALNNIETATVTVRLFADCAIYVYRPGAGIAVNSQFTALIGNTYNLSKGMIHIFKSNVIPQIVDLGNIGVVNIDDIVTNINSKISSGVAEKINPRQFQIRSSKFNNGTAAILALVGNSTSVFNSPKTSTSIQPHTASASSNYAGSGFPIVKEHVKPTSNFAFRSYLKIDRDLFRIFTKNKTPTINSNITGSAYPIGFDTLWITGNNYGLISRIYQSEKTFPYEGFMSSDETILHLGPESDGSPPAQDIIRNNFALKLNDLPINNNDKLVVEMDLDPTDKTVAINLAKKAKIQTLVPPISPGIGSLFSFTFVDPEDGDKPFSNLSSVYKEFNFNDFKVLFRNIGIYDLGASRYLYLRSTSYGSQSRLNFSIQHPTEPNSADLQITHVNDFDENDDPRTTVIVTQKSGALETFLTSGNYRVNPDVNVANNRTFFISSGGLDISLITLSSIINISGGSPINGSFNIISLHKDGNYTGAAASVVNGQATVTVTAAAHNLTTGDLVTITTNSSIGGILPINLSVQNAAVTVINANTFSYNATANATSTASGTLDSVKYGIIKITTPSNGGITSSTIYSASQYPLRFFPPAGFLLQEIADLINDYLPENPIITAQPAGNFTANVSASPTYVTLPSLPLFTGTDMNDAFLYRVFKTKYAGQVGIRNYNKVTATFDCLSQTEDSPFPSPSEIGASGYSAVGELAYIVPTNVNTLKRWVDFNAISSLNVVSNIEKTNSGKNLQISSKVPGEAGAVKTTGVSANNIFSPIIGNASKASNGQKVSILSADAKAIPKDTLVKIKNKQLTELERPYKLVPTGTSITAANTVDVDPWFRATNSIKYIKVSQNKARIIFLRNGKGPSQTEPLTGATQVTLTNIGSGRVQVQITGGTGVLSARVGDIMYVKSSSPFPKDVKCLSVPDTGVTLPDLPSYIGHTVVDVIDDDTIVISAPGITSFGATTLSSATDIVFMPAIWNEKNIRTDKKDGQRFNEPHSAAGYYYIIKSLGNGFCYLCISNGSSNDLTNSGMKLNEYSVSTDDYLILSDVFHPLNQGTFRIIAHNGNDQIIFYNPESNGKDEVIDLNNSTLGEAGIMYWSVGRASSKGTRSIRVLDSNCVKIGDYLRISSSINSSQWFNQSVIGSWKITGIGYQAIDYTGVPLPHTTSSGTFDIDYIAPYVEVEIPNAPVSIKDSNGNHVDKFLIGQNTSSIGFLEANPIEIFRLAKGHNVNSINQEESDLFLIPNRSISKISDIYESVLSVPYKLDFPSTTATGLDGYKIFSGLVRQAHRIIDGLPSNVNLFPGVKASGTIIEVLPPLIKSIEIDLQVRPKDGVTLTSLSDLVKSTTERYINSVGVGKPVVISEIIRVVQGLPGVFSVTVLATRPEAIDDRIVVAETEKPFVINVFEDISVG